MPSPLIGARSCLPTVSCECRGNSLFCPCWNAEQAPLVVSRHSLPQEDRVLSEPIVAGVGSTSTPAATEPSETGQTGSSTLLSLIVKSLEDDVAEDIVSISLAGKSSEADTMVVASGRSTRHVSAIADKLMDRLKHDAGVIARVEGKEAADWVLIDAGDVIVHIFRPEVREFYQLEKMWMNSPDATARASGH